MKWGTANWPRQKKSTVNLQVIKEIPTENQREKVDKKWGRRKKQVKCLGNDIEKTKYV